MNKILVAVLGIIVVALAIAAVYLVFTPEPEPWVPDPPDPTISELGSIQHYITIYYTDDTVAKIPTLSLFSVLHESKPVVSMIYTVEAKTKTGIIQTSVENYYLYITVEGAESSDLGFYPTAPFEKSVSKSWTKLTDIPMAKTDIIGMHTAGTYTVTVAPSGVLSYKDGMNWKSTSLPSAFSFEVEFTESELFLVVGVVNPVYD